MKLLAIETTGPVSSVSFYDGEVLTEIKNTDTYSHLQQLMPMVKELMDGENIKGEDLTAIAVSQGPGSFTGIRIGMASAKGLAQIWDKPIIEVPTLAAFAFGEYDFLDNDKSYLFVPVIDAKMHQVYAGAFKPCSDHAIIPAGVYELEEFLNNLEEKAESYDAVIFFGDGEECFKERLSECSFTHAFAPAEDMNQTSLAVAKLGALIFERGENIKTCFTANPEYFRLPEAERKLLEKKQEGK